MKPIYRSLEILETLVAGTTGMSVSELAQAVDIPPSSVHRILSCLKEKGYVIQDGYSKRYHIGYKILSLSGAISDNNSLVIAAKPYMDQLRTELHKTIILYVLDHTGAVCIHFAPYTDVSMFYIKPGTGINPYATASGKCILAYSNHRQLSNYLARYPMKKVTPFTIDSQESLLVELDKIRHQGFAVCDQELQVGAQALACPVFDVHHNPIAAVGFVALKSEITIIPSNIKALQDCAKSISRALGQNT